MDIARDFQIYCLTSDAVNVQLLKKKCREWRPLIYVLGATRKYASYGIPHVRVRTSSTSTKAIPSYLIPSESALNVLCSHLAIGTILSTSGFHLETVPTAVRHRSNGGGVDS